MIHYDLRCGGGHTFDGWFRSSAAFEHQADSGLLDCPFCASTDVTRAIMAPRLSRGATAPARDSAPSPPAAESKAVSAPEAGTGLAAPAVTASRAVAANAAPAMPDEVRAVLQRVRAEVERRCDYVGAKFAEEARAMHHGEQKRRSIYGETTPEQAEALAEEGIEVSRIPWVPRADG